MRKLISTLVLQVTTTLMLEIWTSVPGIVTWKLSKMTLPGAFASICHVPPLSSKMIADVEIDECHASVNCCVQVPGTPPLPVAVLYRLPDNTVVSPSVAAPRTLSILR